MAAFLIVELDYDEKGWIAAYDREVPPLIAAHGGHYLVRTTRAKLIEGAPAPAFVTAILEFPSAADANAFLESEAYRPHATARRAAGRTRMLLLESR